ncbi:hypothetical protein ACV3P1_12720 [Clostridium perfringens]|uniref:hypothetical protein n=1 Tax=Clostridium perfringens TaxID=1502 RepID=UPI0039EAFB58|nr:hypothetical protein [Clostridium perfringens]
MNEALRKLKSESESKALYKVSKDELDFEFNKIFKEYDEKYSVLYKYRRDEYIRVRSEEIYE